MMFNKDKSYRAFNTHFVYRGEYTCGTCRRLYPQTGRCSYVGYKHRYDEPVRDCRKFDGPMSPDERDYAEFYHEMTGRRFYYILTAIFEVLGLKQDNDVYQTIKSLIQKVRAKEENVKEAVHYDTYGEEIAENLVRDVDTVNICQGLLTNYLAKVYVMIKNNQEEAAIALYSNMVNSLQERYTKEAMVKESIFENKQMVLSK